MAITIANTPPLNNASIAGTGDLFTKILTNDSIIINQKSSVKYVTIKNVSAVNGTLQGNNSQGGSPSSVLPIALDEVVSLTTAFIFQGMTIDAPLGCTLHIIIGF